MLLLLLLKMIQLLMLLQWRHLLWNMLHLWHLLNVVSGQLIIEELEFFHLIKWITLIGHDHAVLSIHQWALEAIRC